MRKPFIRLPMFIPALMILLLIFMQPIFSQSTQAQRNPIVRQATQTINAQNAFALAVSQEIALDEDGIDQGVFKIAANPNGKLLAAATYDGVVHLLDAKTGQVRKTLTLSTALSDLEFSPDGNLLAIVDQQTGAYIFNAITGQELAATGLDGIVPNPEFVTFSPDGTTLILGGSDTIALIPVDRNTVDFENPEIISVTLNNIDSITALDYASDRLAVCDVNGQLLLLDGQTGEELNRTTVNSCYDLVFSSDGAHLAVANYDTVTVFEPDTLTSLATLSTGAVLDLAFSADSSLLVTSGYSIITVWDMTSLEPIAGLLTVSDTTTYYGPIQAVAFAANDTRLIASITQDSLMVFELADLTGEDYLQRAQDMRLMLQAYLWARLDYDRVLADDHSNATAYFGRGACRWELGNYADSIDDLNLAIEYGYEPLDEAYRVRGLGQDAVGNYDAALDDYTKAIDLNPSNLYAYQNRAYVYYARFEDWESSIADYEAANEISPSAHNYNGVGWGLVQLGQYEDALVALNKSIELDPYYSSAIDSRGWAYLGLKQYDEAEDDFDQAISLGETYSYYGLGQLYWQRGDSEKALENLNLYLSYAGDTPEQGALDLLDAINRGETYTGDIQTDQDNDGTGSRLGGALGHRDGTNADSDNTDDNQHKPANSGSMIGHLGGYLGRNRP